MERMNLAFEKVKMLVGMEVEEAPPPDNDVFSFMDDFNRQCTLSTKQVRLLFVLRIYFGSSWAKLEAVEL